MPSPVKSRIKRGKKKPIAKNVLKLSHFWAGPEQQPVDALVDQFEKKYPDTKVKQNIMDWWTYKAAVRREMVEAPPDVIICDIGETLVRLAENGQITDLTDMWKNKGFSDVFPEWMKEKCSFRGKIYGVPSKYFTYAVWYLTDVFKEYGVKPPKTGQEFLKACTSFKEAGIHPVIASGDGMLDWFMNILARIAGVEFYNGLVRGMESWRNLRVIKAFEFLRDLSTVSLHPHPFGFNPYMAWTRLNKREAAMYLQGDWVNGMWQREFNYTPGEEYDYFLLPPINPKIGQVMVVGGNAWMLPRDASNPKEAKSFIEYAGSLEAHELMAQKGMGLLAHRDVSDKAYDIISLGLRNELAKYPNVHSIGAALPLKITSVVQAQVMKIVLNPTIKREGIDDLASEIELVAREHRVLESLYAFRDIYKRQYVSS